MSESRKKPGVAFWATVVVVAALVAYPLSVGPVECMHVHLGFPHWVRTTVDFIYEPLFWAMRNGPQWFRVLFSKYISWWMELGT